MDVLDKVMIPEEGFVVVVGALVLAIKALKQRGKPFGILEWDPLTLKKMNCNSLFLFNRRLQRFRKRTF